MLERCYHYHKINTTILSKQRQLISVVVRLNNTDIRFIIINRFLHLGGQKRASGNDNKIARYPYPNRILANASQNSLLQERASALASAQNRLTGTNIDIDLN